jgi:hypothetical protein
MRGGSMREAGMQGKVKGTGRPVWGTVGKGKVCLGK